VDIVSITDQADEKLFQLVLTNPNHVLSSLVIRQINTTTSEQDATTNNMLTNATSYLVIIL